MHTETATEFTVSVDRATINRRGRLATIFVEAPLTATAREIRDAAEVHLLSGEFLQFAGGWKSATPETTHRHEFAVFA